MSRNYELLSQFETDLGTSDNHKPSIVTHASSSAFANSYAGDICKDEIVKIVQRVFLSNDDSAPRRVVFCGVDRENGSSVVCVQAARVLASIISQPVCIVDAKIRTPRLVQKVASTLQAPFLNTDHSPQATCEQMDSNLWLAGPELLAEGFGSILSVDKVRRRLAEMLSSFEYVLIDAPGAIVSGDATILGQAADAAVLVIEANSTRRLTAQKAKEALDASGVRLLGTVLHNRTFPIPEKLYKRL
jgi:hypothetical protein